MNSSLDHSSGSGRVSWIEPGDGVALRGRARDARRTANGRLARAHSADASGTASQLARRCWRRPPAGLHSLPAHLRWPVGLLLIGLGLRLCYRHRHVRWASMRVGMGGLTWWSFLMASAHGAGLMVLPLFLSMTAASGAAPACHGYASMQAGLGIEATLAHAVGYLSGHSRRCVDCGPLFRSRTAAEGVDQS